MMGSLLLQQAARPLEPGHGLILVTQTPHCLMPLSSRLLQDIRQQSGPDDYPQCSPKFLNLSAGSQETKPLLCRSPPCPKQMLEKLSG
jgi:hypothetical protein